MELDPRRLLVLRAVAEHGGVAAAARALGHTPSAVSQQLARLEREAGVPLLDRSGGRAELTAAGAALAVHAESVARALAQARQELEAFGAQAAGPVAIGVPPSAITHFAATALGLLAAAHPALRPALHETGRTDGLRLLRRGTLDVLLLEDDREAPAEPPPGTGSRVLVEGVYRVVVPEGCRLPLEPDELARLPWIGAAEGAPRSRALARLGAAHGFVPDVRHRAGNPFAVYSLLAARLGAAVLPDPTARMITHGTVADLEVPGRYLLRVLWRTTHAPAPAPGPDAEVAAPAPPAVAAVVRALGQALLLAAERLREAGVLHTDPVVRPHIPEP